jgi:hypothetical protein
MYCLRIKDSSIIGEVLDQLNYEIVSENVRSYKSLGIGTGNSGVFPYPWARVRVLQEPGGL